MRNTLTYVLSTITLCFAMLAYADDAEVTIPATKIVGAEKIVPLGELVHLQLTPITKPPTPNYSRSVTWVLVDVTVGVEKAGHVQGESVFFGAGTKPSKVLVFCTVVHAYVIMDGEAVKSFDTREELVRAELKLGSDTPPGPNPNPGPEPGPTPDVGFGLTKLVRDIVLAKVEFGPNRANAAKQTAVTFSSFAEFAKSGGYPDTQEGIEKFLEDTAKTNATVLRTLQFEEKWKPVAGVIQDALNEMYESGKLVSIGDFAKVWIEIRDGLLAASVVQ